jgi:hypothetical protein
MSTLVLVQSLDIVGPERWSLVAAASGRPIKSLLVSTERDGKNIK